MQPNSETPKIETTTIQNKHGKNLLTLADKEIRGIRIDQAGPVPCLLAKMMSIGMLTNEQVWIILSNIWNKKCPLCKGKGHESRCSTFQRLAKIDGTAVNNLWKGRKDLLTAARSKLKCNKQMEKASKKIKKEEKNLQDTISIIRKFNRDDSLWS